MREVGTFKGIKLKENTKSRLNVLRCFLWPFEVESKRRSRVPAAFTNTQCRPISCARGHPKATSQGCRREATLLGDGFYLPNDTCDPLSTKMLQLPRLI